MSNLALFAPAAPTGPACANQTKVACDDGLDLDVLAIRAQFSILEEHPELIFFDNASTTHKPESVIECMDGFYRRSCANAGRASYSWSTRLSSQVESSRKSLAKLLNAESPDHIAFTGGATESLNVVATSWGLHNLRDGDEVMVCFDDHRSALLPWLNLQEILRRFGVNIDIVPFLMHDSGTYDRKSISSRLTPRTRLIALSHVHHLYGMEMDIPELRRIIPGHVLISLDASQSIGHTAVDVQSLGAHFVSFSGHKMFAANGIGVLWAHPQILPELWPTKAGAKSAMLISSESETTLDNSSLAGLVECGTLNLPAILSFRPAVDFMHSIGVQKMEQYISRLTHRLHEKLKLVPGVEFAPGLGRCHCTKGYGIIAFKIAGIASGDVASFLETDGIFVRTGDHCRAAQNTHDDYIRVSLQIYNSREEIDRFAEVLTDATS